MPGEPNEGLFKIWIYKREEFRKYKKNKDWAKIIKTCDEIIELDLKDKSIAIMVPIFINEKANALDKIGDKQNAIKYFQSARDAFEKFRVDNGLSTKNDWLSDIESISKRLSKLTK